MDWISTHRHHAAQQNISKRRARERVHTLTFALSPALTILRDAEGSILRRLPDVLLAVVSRFVSNLPETKLLEELVQAGRVPQPILVEMARMSCSGRRLQWKNGRFMSTKLKCHRHHCCWRKQGKQCITWCSGYTTATFIKKFFRVRGVPKGCWNQQVESRGVRRRYIDTAFERLPH